MRLNYILTNIELSIFQKGGLKGKTKSRHYKYYIAPNTYTENMNSIY